MSHIKGITVSLVSRVQNGTDDFGKPIYEDATPVDVSNVLVSPATSEDVINELSLSGKHLVYKLAIPKGDTHDWVDAKVLFFDTTFKVVGIPQGGIEDMIPLEWNKKVNVERYE